LGPHREEVHKHLAAVARLPSDAMAWPTMADGWVSDAERCMAQAVAFYAQAALQRPGVLPSRGWWWGEYGG